MLYKDGRVTVELLSEYLYEVTIYVHFKMRSECLFSKFISSKKELKVKKDVVVMKKTKQYTVVKYLELLGAPQSYMNRRGLKPIE